MISSAKVLGLAVFHTKVMEQEAEIPTPYELRVLRSKALTALTNSGLRAQLGRLGLELVVEPDEDQ